MDRPHHISKSTKRNETIFTGICYAYFILFFYTALSKLAIYDQSEIQLSKSPIISSYADTIAWALPTTEILIAIALLIQRTKLAAIYASLALMVVFTSYIYTILNSGGHVPCSCGGVISSMDWHQHLYFNLAFIALAITAIFLYPKNKQQQPTKAAASPAGDKIFGAQQIRKGRKPGIE